MPAAHGAYSDAALPNGTHSLHRDGYGCGRQYQRRFHRFERDGKRPDSNLVTNGSFETGNFSGWTLGGNFGVISAGPQTSVDGNAESGQFAANIGAIGSDATLSQAIQTTAGQHYTLTFWLANASGWPERFYGQVERHDAPVLANAPAQGYTQYTFDVVGNRRHVATANQRPARSVALEFGHHLGDADRYADRRPAPTITSFSPDTGVVGDGITDPAILTLTGTAVANSTVNVYDGTTLLGTATANASGAWSFITAALAGRGAIV